ncbi:Rieske 2Fe-2S domain-containing protein [Roseivirga sp. UBA1976]|uniref:Rieske (2Fe-2S) protein n=1 Tax=Roseivirga sp. UBA1976 TaxID=1947386 RepID=UPI00257CD556|nr:Rieske 2Fe-2S domain-containing protein [Roseivirga sp. UBA1976]|tara:strand:- start:406 stop:729 length:324 start_codon:yes stop_codon:yes gene_type:complete
MPSIRVFENTAQLHQAFAHKSIRLLRIGEKKVCLARHRQAFFAFEHLCPHQMHPLSEAQITAFGEVVCPLHAYRFHLQTGSEANQKCRDLKTFEVEIRQEGVFINLY